MSECVRVCVWRTPEAITVMHASTFRRRAMLRVVGPDLVDNAHAMKAFDAGIPNDCVW